MDHIVKRGGFEAYLERFNLDTGDILIFNGSSTLSKAIKFFTSTVFSHSALVWRCPHTKKLYVWENGEPGEKEYPMITKKKSDLGSAHLIPLYKKIRHYDGQVYVRPLVGDRTLEFYQKFDKFVGEHLGKPYRCDFIATWNQNIGFSLLPLPFMDDNKSDPYSWVCSELVVKTLEYAGVIKLSVRANSVIPQDLAKDDSSKIITNEGFVFTDLEAIKY